MPKGSIIGKFVGKCCDSTVFNNNDMKLSRKLFEVLFASEDYKRAIKYRHYIGFLGHPHDPGCMDYRNACIVMTECHMDDNGEVFGSFDLIDTPVGRVVKAFIDAGVTFGISIRGAGDVDYEGNVEPESFVFRGFDLVTFPAYDDCIPTFQEIAASSDLDKQVKYKKVCSTIKTNLSKITSSEALEFIQNQLNEGTDEFNAVQGRLEELASEDSDDDSQITEEKLKGMTQLYLDERARNAELECALVAEQAAKNELEVECSRQLTAYKRVVAKQLSDMESSYNEVVASNNLLKKQAARLQKSVQASEALNTELSTVKDENLKYVHKIEAANKTIAKKDSAIEDLEKRLNETVVANTKLQRQTSNLDGNVAKLTERVAAAEQMVLNYQQAYANMYANALGVHLENLSITASTSVEELQDMICSGTSSANMAVSPDIDDLPDEFVDDAESNEMVTI